MATINVDSRVGDVYTKSIELITEHNVNAAVELILGQDPLKAQIKILHALAIKYASSTPQARVRVHSTGRVTIPSTALVRELAHAYTTSAARRLTLNTIRYLTLALNTTSSINQDYARVICFVLAQILGIPQADQSTQVDDNRE